MSRRLRQKRLSARKLLAIAGVLWLGLVLLRCVPALFGEHARSTQGPATPGGNAARAEHRARQNSKRARGDAPRSEPGHSDARTDDEIAASEHVALGVPVDADPADDYLMDQREYVVSYNPKRRVPNWVAWKLRRSDLGESGRSARFFPDAALPADFYRVTPADYRKSAYDRGHLCPSADRDDTPERNARTFLMTNVEPQLHELNAGPWEKLEAHERELARRPHATLFIVAGGIFVEPCATIGNQVAVPAANYKIIVALREGEGAADVRADSDVIAVIMPNERGVGAHAWTDFATSVDEVERRSGYDFLTRVPRLVQDALEARNSDVF